jgi:nucleoside-diphosphate-sugar epimerase
LTNAGITHQNTIRTEEELERKLATPSEALIHFIKELEGDIAIFGAGGKMGPSLAKLAHNAVQAAGVRNKVTAVSQFSSDRVRKELEVYGVNTIRANLLNQEALKKLPDFKNIVYMVGQKFGTTGNEPVTWAINTYLSGLVAERFRDSRFSVFSTGNVYPLVPIKSEGATEENATSPIGEYAQSRLGGERVFQYFSSKYGTRVAILRLNYAVELRYGVLHDVALSVMNEKPIDLRMPYVNVIWQGDANEIGVRSLGVASSSPPTILNVTGPEIISIRWLAQEFSNLFGKQPVFIVDDDENEDKEKVALLSNASKAHRIFGFPKVTLHQMIFWVAEWLKGGGTSLNKPTHFQEREGKF